MKGDNVRKDIKGEKNPRWNNGASEYLDHAILKKNRLEVLTEAKGRCQVCGERAYIVHHIDGFKNNHDLSNLVALCRKCHTIFHKSDDMFMRGKNENSINTSSRSKYVDEYGMTMEELATYIGVSRPTILAWRRHPRKKEWIKKLIS